jgi:catechol 2,3-dioxygenase-like lactoylglutathione lyase family enzyme
MKLNAIGVTSSNLQKTVDFYKLLGFQFPEFKPDEQHLEPLPTEGSARLMIDSKELITSLIGEDPKPSSHSAFALEYDSAAEVNDVAAKVKEAGFKVDKEPWDAFWGQRYAVVEDPDGYKVDLYAAL